MIRALIAVALLATPAAAQAPTFGAILELCAQATFDDPAKAGQALAALPEGHRQLAMLMCASYQAGADERLARIQNIKGARYI